jgi:hypothetical protein
MAKGGARPGAGRKPGKMLALTDYLKQKDIDAFLAYLLSNYEQDGRIAIWFADHLFGKAPQPLTGADGGPIEITGVEINVRKK